MSLDVCLICLRRCSYVCFEQIRDELVPSFTKLGRNDVTSVTSSFICDRISRMKAKNHSYANRDVCIYSWNLQHSNPH